MARPDGTYTQATRVVRLLRTLRALPPGAAATLAELGAATGAAERTLRRDLAALVAAGEPVRVARGRVWLAFAAEPQAARFSACLACWRAPVRIVGEGRCEACYARLRRAEARA
jgi:hypothetical protein